MIKEIIKELEELKESIKGISGNMLWNLEYNKDVKVLKVEELSRKVEQYINHFISDKDKRNEMLERLNKITCYLPSDNLSYDEHKKAFIKGRDELASFVDGVILDIKYSNKESSKTISNSNSISGQNHTGNVQINGDGNHIIINTTTESCTKKLKEELVSIDDVDSETKKKLNKILDDVDTAKKEKKPIQDKISEFINTAGTYMPSVMNIVTQLLEMSK